MALDDKQFPQALGNLLKEKEIENLENEMFCYEKAPARERWLLGFAAPFCQVVDISSGYMYSDSFYASSPGMLAENRQIFRERWGVENADELRELIERGIARPAALYLDRIFLALRDYAPERYFDVIVRIVPANKHLKKNAAKFEHILPNMLRWQLKIPDKTVYAFDLSRAATLAVQGYWLQYIDKIEAVLYLERIARQSGNYYKQWSDYIASTVLGYELWRMSTQTGKFNNEIYRCARMLLRSPQSSYNDFAIHFDEGLALNSKAAYTPEYNQRSGATLIDAVYTNKEDYIADGQDFDDRLNLCVNPDRLGKDPDPISEKFWNESQNQMFPDALVDDLEKWLCTFAAPLTGLNGLPTNHLAEYKGIQFRNIVRILKKDFRISNHDSLLNEAATIFSDGLTKHNDIILMQIVNKAPDTWAKEISTYVPINFMQTTNIGKLQKVKQNLGYYNLPLPTVTTHAYDMSRVAFLALAGYGVGYLTKEEAINLLRGAAWCADKYYGSWSEFFGAYLFGRAVWKWSTNKFKQITDYSQLRKVRIALNSAKSTCQRYSFKQFFALCERPKNLYIPYPYKNNGVLDNNLNIKHVK